ncbi:MAG: hypothetical protein K0Q75_904 [Anaerospora sp.]|nr:hypothetical protein [Anaerospora sp.]
MKNVYDEVYSFYEEEIILEPVIKREWVEGYLRQKAWQGANDGELRQIWNHIRYFELYLDATENDYTDCLEDIPAQEYGLVIYWLIDNIQGYKKSLKAARRFFDILLDLYKYLVARRVLLNYDELELAAQEIAGGKRLELFPIALMDEVEQQHGKSSLVLTSERSLSTNDPEVVGETVEHLMTKLGNYFQQREFTDDFHRALFLFNGPLAIIPGEDQDDFWLGFWDYFLFDYHLLVNDLTPLAHFQSHYGSKLLHDERHILQELLSATFCVFYIDRVINGEWVECVNLFTEEKFALFNIQEPAGSWLDMFSRHALVVRHTINALSTMDKVNVTPFNQVDRVYPSIAENSIPNQAVIETLEHLMPEYGFSQHDIRLAKRLWYDYCQLTRVTVRKPQVWAAAVIFSYSMLNSYNVMPADNIAADLAISKAGIYTNRTKLYDMLQLQKFDPRYLNEEGFVLSLFT